MGKQEKYLHYLGHRKRIKKRFINTGLENFADYEVFEFLLTYAIAKKDVKPIAKNLLASLKTFQHVLDAPFELLTKVNGIGEHSAILLKLVKSCSDYYLREKLQQKNIISSPDDLIKYCKSVMASLGDEQFRVIYLNSKNEIICDELLWFKMSSNFN